MGGVILFLLFFWLGPILLAYVVGWSVGQNKKSSNRADPSPLGHGLQSAAADHLAAIRALDRLFLVGRLDRDAYLEARAPLAEDCERAGVPVPQQAAPTVQLGGIESARAGATSGVDETCEPIVDAELVLDADDRTSDRAADRVMDEGKGAKATEVAYVTDAAPKPPQRADGDAVFPVRPQPSASAPWDDLPDESETPPAPRRTWAELLQAFMEDKNIRWGELLSGILIIGSAVGLVLSLREQLQETIPYFPSLMFLLIIGMVHGAGNYTYRRWKLETTSRGVLVIGMLLIPLGLLAACLLSAKGEVREVTDPLYLTAVVIGLGGYGAMAHYSSRLLLPERPLPLAVGVLGPAVSTLLIHRAASHSITWSNMLLGALPLALASVAPIRQSTASPWRPERYAQALGMSAFAAAAPLVYWVTRTGGPPPSSRTALPVLAAAFALLSTSGPCLAAGLR